VKLCVLLCYILGSHCVWWVHRRRLWNKTRAKIVNEMQAVRDLCKELDSFRRPPQQDVATTAESSSASEDSEDSDGVDDDVPGYMRPKSAGRRSRPTTASSAGGKKKQVKSSGYGQKKSKKKKKGKVNKHGDKKPYSETLPGDAVDKELCQMIEREIVDFDAHVRWDDIAELTDAKRLLEEVRC